MRAWAKNKRGQTYRIKFEASYAALIREAQDRFGLKIRALAVMDDHVHLVVKVSSRNSLPQL